MPTKNFFVRWAISEKTNVQFEIHVKYGLECVWLRQTKIKLVQLMSAKLSPCLIKDHAREVYGGMKVQLPTFWNVALDGGEWSSLGP